MAQHIQPTPRGQAIQLPADTARKWRLTKPVFGGPVFDFPALGLTGINLAQLTDQQAERLYRKGWAGIEPVPVLNTFLESPASKALPKASKPDGEQ